VSTCETLTRTGLTQEEALNLGPSPQKLPLVRTYATQSAPQKKKNLSILFSGTTLVPEVFSAAL
jgi:hypothetical protein